MKEFIKVKFDPVICRFQLEEFKELLQQKNSLSEKMIFYLSSEKEFNCLHLLAHTI